MLRLKRLLGLAFTVAVVLAAPGIASAEYCQECRVQPFGRCADKFTCIFSFQNKQCSYEWPCSDWCIEYGSEEGCPI